MAGSLDGRIQRCTRCGWEFPIQPPAHLDVEPKQIQEGAEVEYRERPNGFTLTMLNLGDTSPLPECLAA